MGEIAAGSRVQVVSILQGPGGSEEARHFSHFIGRTGKVLCRDDRYIYQCAVQLDGHSPVENFRDVELREVPSEPV